MFWCRLGIHRWWYTKQSYYLVVKRCSRCNKEHARGHR